MAKVHIQSWMVGVGNTRIVVFENSKELNDVLNTLHHIKDEFEIHKIKDYMTNENFS